MKQGDLRIIKVNSADKIWLPVYVSASIPAKKLGWLENGDYIVFITAVNVDVKLLDMQSCKIMTRYGVGFVFLHDILDLTVHLEQVTVIR